MRSLEDSINGWNEREFHQVDWWNSKYNVMTDALHCKYTQTKSRVEVALVRAISAYGSSIMRVVLHWAHWLPYKTMKDLPLCISVTCILSLECP